MASAASSSLKTAVLDLEKYIDREVSVRFQGGREGFDQLVNVVLDDCIETLRDPEDPYRLTHETRRLGLVVCRGQQVSLVSPNEGMEEIANPFVAPDDEEEEEA